MGTKAWTWDREAKEYRRKFADGARGVALLSAPKWEGRLVVGRGITNCGLHPDSRAAMRAVDQAQRKASNAPTTPITTR